MPGLACVSRTPGLWRERQRCWLIGALCPLLCLMGGCQEAPAANWTQALVDDGVHNRLSAAEREDGWQLLFDGLSLSGWHSYGRDEVGAEWQVISDSIVLTAPGGGDLVTDTEFENFELSLQWWIEPGGNSGVFVLADESRAPIYAKAPEIQVLDNEGHSDGHFADRRSGSLYDLIAAPAAAQKPAQQWNRLRVRHQQGRLQAWQNGVETFDVTIDSGVWRALLKSSKFVDWEGFGLNPAGLIGLQDHGDRVAFRNIKIRPLPAPDASR